LARYCKISKIHQFKGTVARDFLTLVFSLIDRPWGMFKVSIFSFLIFGDFNELLANSVLLAMCIEAARKKVFLNDPLIFFVNHISMQVKLALDFFF